ncbi:hypothetical protein [Streptomyces sp. NPDC056144]|uniref:hypothetical protein n=1 Tax=unclassified Streptomyces TaxID=2593676 RepID=UPI0035DD5DA1
MTEQIQTEASVPAQAAAEPAPAPAPALDPDPTPDPAPGPAPDPTPDPAPGPGPAPDPDPTPASAPAVAGGAEPVPPSRASRRPLLWGVLRWTAAVLVFGGVGAGTALGITAMDRDAVPGLATESDGRWTYPRLALPALPADAPRPWTEGNEGEVHHADLRQLLLPAPAEATLDPKAKGGWTGVDAYLALLPEKERGAVKEHLAESALRHVATRGWTTPDGTTTRVHLLRFSSVAFSEALKDETLRKISQNTRLPVGVESAKIDMSVKDVRVPNLSVYAYEEEEPYGGEQTRWAYVQAGDTFGVITQTRKGGVLTVPFQQTVALQAQLLG